MIHVVDVHYELSLPICVLFNDVAKSKNLVRVPALLSKTCFFVFQLLVHSFRDMADELG